MRMRARFLVAGVVVFGLQGCACPKKPDERKQLGKVVSTKQTGASKRRLAVPKTDSGSRERQEGDPMPTQKSEASGTINEGANRYVYTAEYWGVQNKSENFAPLPGSGPQPWQGLMKRLAKARTWEDYVACYTDDSRPGLEEFRSKLEKRWKTRDEDENKEPIQRQYYLTVKVLSDGTERLFMTLSTEYMAPEEAGPPFTVQVLRKVGSEYKIDRTQTKNPIFRALQWGNWKQFGAPRDYSDVQDDAISTQSAP